MKVYLAGGMRGSWREKVKATAPWHTYYDPTEHCLGDNTAEYTLWDLAAVDACDLVFAYMEQDNPSGYGMVLELGYAKGLGKKTILVDEKQDKYFAIVREAVDLNYTSLDSGIHLLGVLSLIG